MLYVKLYIYLENYSIDIFDFSTRKLWIQFYATYYIYNHFSLQQRFLWFVCFANFLEVAHLGCMNAIIFIVLS